MPVPVIGGSSIIKDILQDTVLHIIPQEIFQYFRIPVCQYGKQLQEVILIFKLGLLIPAGSGQEQADEFFLTERQQVFYPYPVFQVGQAMPCIGGIRNRSIIQLGKRQDIQAGRIVRKLLPFFKFQAQLAGHIGHFIRPPVCFVQFSITVGRYGFRRNDIVVRINEFRQYQAVNQRGRAIVHGQDIFQQPPGKLEVKAHSTGP